MSHEATNWAIKRKGLKPASKIVLWHLADRHNPDFGCFPSQRTLAIDCEMSERSVRSHLEILENSGLIRRQKRRNSAGVYTSDRYILGVEADFNQLPAANISDGKNECDPAANTGSIQRQILPTNLVKEPSKEPVIVKDTPKSVLCRFAGDEAVSSFLEYRRKKKGGALTLTAAKRLSKHLDAINRDGGDADDALGMAEEKGWSSVEPTWYFNTINNHSDGIKHNGKQSYNEQASARDGARIAGENHDAVRIAVARVKGRA